MLITLFSSFLLLCRRKGAKGKNSFIYFVDSIFIFCFQSSSFSCIHQLWSKGNEWEGIRERKHTFLTLGMYLARTSLEAWGNPAYLPSSSPTTAPTSSTILIICIHHQSSLFSSFMREINEIITRERII